MKNYNEDESSHDSGNHQSQETKSYKQQKLSWQAIPEPQNTSTPNIKNHTATLYKNKLYVFGGYDGKKNHSSLRVFDTERNTWIKPRRPSGSSAPMGRNGHTATLVQNRLYIIGGWLGQGPLAADDLHILDLENLRWINFTATGEPPGPCNMHTADCYMNKIYVFRGGDGRDYLNDLHELDTEMLQWTKVEASGTPPPPRANHSSSLIQQNLYIFGGWDGAKRLNDLFSINLRKKVWTQVKVQGESPAPRAGMSLANVKDKLFLFGGSGPHAQCFNDLYVFDPEVQSWQHCNNFKDPEKIPKVRAGHSMTLVDTKLYIIGGSYGQDYLKDVYELDTDPQPEWEFSDNSKQNLMFKIRDLVNRPEFSDVTFIVEGKRFFAHKMIISQLSKKFQTMFSAGMMESTGNNQQITLDGISYPVFNSIMCYLYTGEFHFGAETEGQELSLDTIIEFLRVSDEYFLESVKAHCEKHLISMINQQNFGIACEVADLYNADRLKEYCAWYQRMNKISMDGSSQFSFLELKESSSGHMMTVKADEALQLQLQQEEFEPQENQQLSYNADSESQNNNQE